MGLDLIVFLIFLSINLWFGIRSIYRTSTFPQYAIDSKEFTTPTIVAAILTTSYGSVILCQPFNITFLCTLIGNTISHFIIGSLLATRLQPFLNNHSVAQVMGKLYGPKVRKVAAVCGLLDSIVSVAIYLKVLSLAIDWFFHIQTRYSVLMAALIVMFSIGSNGIKVLTSASIIRYATLSIILPAFAWLLWKNIIRQFNYDSLALVFAMKDTWHNLIRFPTSPFYYLVYFIVYAIPSFYPAQFQRILINEQVVQLKRSFNYAGFFSLFIGLFLLLVILLLYKVYGCLDLTIVTTPVSIFSSYLGFKGLFSIAIIAFSMSAASANLHAASVLIINDLENKFKEGRFPAMNFSRYILTIGLAATLIALYIKEPFKVSLIIHCFTKITIGFPLLIALMGICLHPYAVCIGVVFGFIGMLICLSFVPNVMACFIALLIGLCSFIVAQTSLKCEQPFSTRLIPSHAPQYGLVVLWKKLVACITNKCIEFKGWDYVQKQLPKDDICYVLFSFYIILTGCCAAYNFLDNVVGGVLLESTILFPSFFVATFFFVYLCLPSTTVFKKIASLVWSWSYFYFLFLVSIGMLVLSKFAYFSIVIFILNIYLSFLFSSLVQVFFHLVFALLVWAIGLPYINHTLIGIDSCLNNHIVNCILILFVLISSLLYQRRGTHKLFSTIQALKSGQEVQNARQFFSKQQIEALAYESGYVVTQLHRQLLHHTTQVQGYSSLPIVIEKYTTKLKKYFNAIFTHLKHNLYLTINWISIDQLLEECFDAIDIKQVYHTPYVMNHTDHLYIQCDIERIKTLLVNGLHVCQSYMLEDHKKKDIYLYIYDTKLGYRLTLLQGKIQKINAISFVITTRAQRPVILPIYKVVEMADVAVLDGKNCGVYAENQHIINAHYGYCEINNFHGEVTYLYVIPVNIQEITKAFATLSPVVYTQCVPSDAISKAEEAAFLEKIIGKQGINEAIIRDVLQLIKLYYAGQKRKTGELFYLHPVAVASILLNIAANEKLIILGLVHDVVQNTPLTEAGLTTLLGEDISETVSEIMNLDKKLPLDKHDYALYIKQILNEVHYDAILVKLADTLHNARTIHGHSIEKQKEKATLIQLFYVPLAEHMHVTTIAHELHMHATRVLNFSGLLT